MLAIVDYGAGNLRSVVNAFRAVGCEPTVTSLARDILSARAVVLPGVGAAGATVDSLNSNGLGEAISRVIAEGRPFFGICIGLQVLLESTEEGGDHKCLGIIPGKVKKLPAGLKVPHMGWNQVKQKRAHDIFEGVPDEANFYFVHSYHAVPDDASLVAGETEYGMPFCSMIARDNVIATQFHPEKSGEAGLRMYANFLKIAKGA